jgi:hypothetical protein
MPNIAVRAAGEAMPAAKNVNPILRPSELPERYAMICDGVCMLPEIEDGTKLIFNRDERPVPGDFVALFWSPEHVKPGEHQVVVKRLVVGPAPWTQWGTPSRGDVQPIVIVEMLNPRRQFYIPTEKLLGMHRCEGPVPADMTTRKVTKRELATASRTR